MINRAITLSASASRPRQLEIPGAILALAHEGRRPHLAGDPSAMRWRPWAEAIWAPLLSRRGARRLWSAPAAKGWRRIPSCAPSPRQGPR